MPDYRALAVLAAQRYGIDPQIFLRQINQESGFNPNAHSSAGAEGIAQFMPSTARGMGINPMDPRQALMAAAKMDSQNLARFGSWQEALAAYNAGGGNANKWNDPNFAGGQTYRYVKDILSGQNVPASAPSAPSAGGGGFTPPKQFTPSQTQQALAAMLLGGAQQTVTDPLAGSNALLQMAMLRSQLGAAQQVYGPAPSAPAQPQADAPIRGTKAGGFLSGNFSYKPGRLDQGHDFQTDPGAPIVAPGSGIVVAVKSDPHGFGPAYPVVHFTSGPYAGKDIYIGHTLSQLKPGQRFTQGQVISHTGTHPIGNASVPGWAEIGYAPNGLPGSFGQSAPF